MSNFEPGPSIEESRREFWIGCALFGAVMIGAILVIALWLI